jgi:hypothetical protein
VILAEAEVSERQARDGEARCGAGEKGEEKEYAQTQA